MNNLCNNAALYMFSSLFIRVEDNQCFNRAVIADHTMAFSCWLDESTGTLFWNSTPLSFTIQTISKTKVLLCALDEGDRQRHKIEMVRLDPN
jgi:hypothetical protein